MTLPTPKELEEFLTSALEAAFGAGNILRKYWGNLSKIEEKSHSGDLVTIADRESEKFIIELLHARYPAHAILGEESGALFTGTEIEGSTSKFIWIIDPLDGTTNYTHQFPLFAVSIALVHENTPLVGVIYAPISGEVFHAVKGQGAYLDNMPISVSKVSKLSYSLLVTGFAYDRRENPDNNFSEFLHLTQLSQGVRRLGSAALDLAYVAAGRLDGYWERGLQPWDVAAGILLVEEAGGCISGYKEVPFDLYSGRILASNKLLHAALSEALLE